MLTELHIHGTDEHFAESIFAQAAFCSTATVCFSCLPNNWDVHCMTDQNRLEQLINILNFAAMKDDELSSL